MTQTDSLQWLIGHLSGQVSERARALALVADKDLRLLGWRGQLNYYGLSALRVGDPIAEHIDLFAGMPLDQLVPVQWACVELAHGVAADVALMQLADGWGITFLDVTGERDVRRHHQQLANELAMLDEQRRALVAELTQAKSDLEEANALKGDFIGRMSHEFRTPLWSILGYTELLEERLVGQREILGELGAVKRGAMHLMNLVENLLDQAGADAGQLDVDPVACDLHDLTQAIDELFRPAAVARKLSLVWWLGADLPARIWIDELRLRQVLINLIGNALKFTQQGGVTVELEWADGRLDVVVSDTGSGIAPELIDKVFQPFHRGDGGSAKGAGLGLSISKLLVEGMHGELTLESTPGKGSRLQFTIDAPARQGGKARVAAERFTDKLVYACDDDPDVLSLLRQYFASVSTHVETAADGAELQRLVKARRPDLVLVDMRAGAKAVGRKIRALGYAGAMVMVGAESNEFLRAQARLSGYDGYWQKPLMRIDVLDRSAALMAGQRSRD